MFKFHVIHIIDDLKSNYVLHHVIIVHEALITPIASITLSQFNYDPSCTHTNSTVQFKFKPYHKSLSCFDIWCLATTKITSYSGTF